MSLPKPKKDETRDLFMGRCLGNPTTKKDFPDISQRIAVCSTQWRLKTNMFKVNYDLKINLVTRQGEIGGVKYLVAPVIAIKEGVHNELMYTTAEISKNLSQWNGVPITINHPQDRRGQNVSANTTPELMEVQVGKLFDVCIKDGALKGELWINIERITELSPTALDKIKNGQLEVSVGLFSEGDGIEGKWNDEPYLETLSCFVPDHIALLPNGIGACSWADGAGVRANKLRENKMKGQFLELDHGELWDRLRSAINQQNTDFVFIDSVFNNYFIYKKEDGSKFFKQTYTVDSKDQVSLTGEPIEVVEVGKDIKFIELKQKEGTMLISKERIDKLFTNANFLIPDTKESRKILTNLSEDEFAKLEDQAVIDISVLTTSNADLQKEKEDLVTTNAELTTKIETLEKDPEPKSKGDKITVNKEELTKEILDSLSYEQVLEKASPDVKEVIESGILANKAEKAVLVKSLEKGPYTAEELGLKSNAELKKLAVLANIVPDFTGKGGNTEVIVNLHERQSDGSGVPKMKTIDEAMKETKE